MHLKFSRICIKLLMAAIMNLTIVWDDLSVLLTSQYFANYPQNLHAPLFIYGEFEYEFRFC